MKPIADMTTDELTTLARRAQTEIWDKLETLREINITLVHRTRQAPAPTPAATPDTPKARRGDGLRRWNEKYKALREEASRRLKEENHPKV